jgi:hypothetical protein
LSFVKDPTIIGWPGCSWTPFFFLFLRFPKKSSRGKLLLLTVFLKK